MYILQVFGGAKIGEDALGLAQKPERAGRAALLLERAAPLELRAGRFIGIEAGEQADTFRETRLNLLHIADRRGTFGGHAVQPYGLRVSGVDDPQDAQAHAEIAAVAVPARLCNCPLRQIQGLRKVAVVGAVKTPGRFELKSAMTVLEVIALAQGFTDFAARDRIVVLRQNGTTTTRMPFNYRKIADGAEQENFLVRPGDIVVVP